MELYCTCIDYSSIVRRKSNIFLTINIVVLQILICIVGNVTFKLKEAINQNLINVNY